MNPDDNEDSPDSVGRPAAEDSGSPAADGLDTHVTADASKTREADACNDLGNACAARGDMAGALANYDEAIRINPRLAMAYTNRANARAILGDLVGAVVDYGKAIEIDPHYAMAYFNRGVAHYARGDLAGALADYSLAIGADPRNAMTYYNRGVVNHALGDFSGAVDDFDAAIRIDPRFCLAYLARGNSLYHVGHIQEAELDYRKGFELDPALIARATIDVLSDGPQHRDRHYENCARHLRRNPGDFISHLRRGLMILIDGRDAEAQADLDQFVLMNPPGKPRLDRFVQEVYRRRGQGTS